jgi:hypothetical protein
MVACGEPNCNSGQIQRNQTSKESRFKGDLPESTQIDAPPTPKVAQFLKEKPQHGWRFEGTGRNCFNVPRTPKYSKSKRAVKHK